MEAFEEQSGWCVAERPVGRGTRDAGRGYVRSMSSALFRAGLEVTGWVFSKQVAGPALICFKGISLQCSVLIV